MNCVVYWLYDDTCVCLWRHGYIGISTQWDRRLRTHRKRLGKVFKWHILFRGTRSECANVEWRLRPRHGIGWNKANGGKPSINYTEAVRAKLRAAVKGRPVSAETRAKRRLVSTGRTNKSRIGQHKSDAERAKISASQTGKRRSEEVKQKLSRLKLGNTNRLGAKLSEETKKAISVTKTGVPVHSEAHKTALSERWKGNSLTKGKPWSAARRLAWLRNKQEAPDADFV